MRAAVARTLRCRRRRFGGSIGPWLLVGLGLSAWCLPLAAETPRPAPDTEQRPRRVLALYSADNLRPANLLFDASLRAALRHQAGAQFECTSEYLDELRYPQNPFERMRDLLRTKHAGAMPDAIVAFSNESVEFCRRHAGDLFPQVPIVFAGVRDVDSALTQTPLQMTGVRSTFDGDATLALALHLHPRVEKLVIIDAPAPIDSVITAARTSGFLRPPSKPEILHLSSLQPRLLEELAALPEKSVVVDLSSADISADPHRAQFLRGPFYSGCDPLLACGVTGSVTSPVDVVGAVTADLVVQVLEREASTPLPSQRTVPARAIVDARRMRQWDVRERSLPAGALVRFDSPSFWRQHLALVLTTSGLFILQSGLIVALVLQSRRRRRAEREALRRREELAHMTRVATMGELTASLAHEINQPLAAILSNAQAGQRLLAADTVDHGEIREILADIAADDRRAGEVIRRMRGLLRKGQSEITFLDPNNLVADVVGLVHSEMILRDVVLELDLCMAPPRIHGDAVQLQQVLLNLLVNALDAMKDLSAGARRFVLLRTAPHEHSIRISVEDSGTGIAVERREEIFDPFVTTKQHGIGLGLAICRSIIEAHGGQIGCTNSAAGGATFWFTLPAVQR